MQHKSLKGITLKSNISLANYTTLRVGGSGADNMGG